MLLRLTSAFNGVNVSASDDSSDDYANISVVGGIVVGCGSCCLSAAASSSFFAVSTRERVFKYDKTAADISDILCTNYYRLFGSEKQHEKSTLPTQHRSYVGAVYYSNLLCNQRLLHENIVFCNRRIPCISNGYCDSMRPFFTSTAISQAAAINS